MKLSELEPKFLKITGDLTHQQTDNLNEADGIMFLCPVCFAANKGPIGTHSIICWQPHVPQDKSPKPGRWAFKGTGYDNLTLVAGSSSILLTGGCNAHFYIKNGNIE